MFNKTVSISMNAAILKEACVELVTVNGRPFSLLDDSGFRKIVDPIVQELNKSKQTVAINPENIRDLVKMKAAAIRTSISQDLQGKLVSMKIDGATRLDRSIMGVNVQFISNGVIEIRTLALTELHEKHTSMNLKEFIITLCEKYKISPEQLYSITTDNGANMVKAVDLLVEELESNDQREREEQEVSITEDFNTMEEEDVFGNGGQASIDEIPLLNDFEVPPYDEQSCTLESNGVPLRGVRCAAHTLQLAVDDALKAANISHTIANARNVSKKLRTQNIMTIIKKMQLKKPKVDCVTRWHSTVDMLLRMLELKEFCVDMAGANRDLHLSPAEWITIESITKALTPAKITTKILQNEQLTMGDFYIEWLKCKIDTAKVKTNFADMLVSKMKDREKKLLENDTFLAAIYLDPRVNVLLTQTQKESAKSHLALTWSRMDTIEHASKIANNRDTENQKVHNANLQHHEMDSSHVNDGDTEDELEMMLKVSLFSVVHTLHMHTLTFFY